MTKSMTGFGRGEHSDDKRSITVEIRSVNHRYADITVKISRRYAFAEERIKNIVKETVKRGKADVSVIVDNLSEGDVDVRLNEPLAAIYIEKLNRLRSEYALEGNVDIGLISSMPDVLKAIPDVDDEDAVADAISIATRSAADGHDSMRRIEGEKLADDIRMRGELVRNLVAQIETRAPAVVEEYVGRMQERIGELIGEGIEIPEERILTEAALFADRSNITEELVRLDSHMKQLALILETKDEPIGKKLDFLVQEMNREANTIGSKANDIEITSRVLEIKSEIEKIREQVQNIE